MQKLQKLIINFTHVMVNKVWWCLTYCAQYISPCSEVLDDINANLTTVEIITVIFLITGFCTILICLFYFFADRCKSDNDTYIFDDNADICYQIWNIDMEQAVANSICTSANARLLRITSNATLALAQSEIASTWILYYT